MLVVALHGAHTAVAGHIVHSDDVGYTYCTGFVGFVGFVGFADYVYCAGYAAHY